MVNNQTIADLAYGAPRTAERRYPDQWGRPPQHPDYGIPPDDTAPPSAPTGPVPPTPWAGPVPPAGADLGAQGTPPPAPPPGTPPAPTNASGWTPNYNTEARGPSGRGSRFEGFNTERAYSGGDAKSTKDLFIRTVDGLGIDLKAEIGTGPDAMARAEALSRDKVVPALIAAGADVLKIEKDRIFIRTAENPDGEWVDIYGDAGGADPRFWWGADGGSSAASKPASSTGAPGSSVAPAPGTSTSPGGPVGGDVARQSLARSSPEGTLLDLAYLYDGRENI